MKDENLCWNCNGRMKDQKIDYFLYEIKIGTVPAKVCKKYNEAYYTEEIAKKISKVAKRKGL